MSSSRMVLFIAALLIVVAIVFKLSQNKMQPAPIVQTGPVATPAHKTTTAAPLHSNENAAQPGQSAAQEVPANEASPPVYVSEYEGKSAAFMALKAKIAAVALQEFMTDKGLRFYSPMKFYDFTLFESDANTMGFDIAPNELRQEMIIAVRRGSDARDLLSDLASERRVSLSGAARPQPIAGKPNFFSFTAGELSILYYAGPAKAGHSAVIAWLQRTPFNQTQIEAFKNSLTRTGI